MDEFIYIFGKEDWSHIEKILSTLPSVIRQNVKDWILEVYYNENLKNYPKNVLTDTFIDTITHNRFSVDVDASKMHFLKHFFKLIWLTNLELSKKNTNRIIYTG